MTSGSNSGDGKRPPTGRKPQADARKAVEAAILREGEVARLALARQTALKALTDPGVLTAKRLARLGSDGLARFVAELRHASLVNVRQGSKSAPAARSGVSAVAPGQRNGRSGSANRSGTGEAAARVKPKALAPGPVKSVQSKTIGVATIPGWWRSTREGAPHFEERARRGGMFAGGLALAACLLLLALTRL